METELLKNFFLKFNEKSINMKMMYYNYEFPYKNIISYIDRINKIPIIEILDYIEKEKKFNDIEFTSSDAVQFSSYENTNIGIINKFKENNDIGFRFKEIGKMLLNDGIFRKETALIKYGENHAKTAEYFGLLFNLKNTFYLSCFGNVFLDLNINDQKKFMIRLIMRSNLFIKLYREALLGEVNVREIFYMLSDKTYIRRRTNIKKIINIVVDNGEYDLSFFRELLVF